MRLVRYSWMLEPYLRRLETSVTQDRRVIRRELGRGVGIRCRWECNGKCCTQQICHSHSISPCYEQRSPPWRGVAKTKGHYIPNKIKQNIPTTK